MLAHIPSKFHKSTAAETNSCALLCWRYANTSSDDCCIITFSMPASEGLINKRLAIPQLLLQYDAAASCTITPDVDFPSWFYSNTGSAGSAGSAASTDSGYVTMQPFLIGMTRCKHFTQRTELIKTHLKILALKCLQTPSKQMLIFFPSFLYRNFLWEQNRDEFMHVSKKTKKKKQF